MVQLPDFAAEQRMHYLLSTPAAVAPAALHGKRVLASGAAVPDQTEAAAVEWAPVMGDGRGANIPS